MLTGTHDLSDGGLAQALVEACLHGGRGAVVTLPALLDPFVALFAESAGRVLVTVAPEDADALLARARAAGVPAERLGTTGGDALTIADVGELDLAELRTTWEATLPALFEAAAAVAEAVEAPR
jgi:phosphoribosylformylglycinamidine synthase subunit PurL